MGYAISWSAFANDADHQQNETKETREIHALRRPPTMKVIVMDVGRGHRNTRFGQSRRKSSAWRSRLWPFLAGEYGGNRGPVQEFPDMGQ